MGRCVLIAFLAGIAAFAAPQEQSTATLEGKNIVVKSAPGAGRISASFHSDADLVFKGTTISAGDYTLYVLTDAPSWQLVISAQTGAKAAVRDPKLDIAKVLMQTVKTPAAAAGNKVTVTKTAAMGAKIEVVSGNTAATALFHLDRAQSDVEW